MNTQQKSSGFHHYEVVVDPFQLVSTQKWVRRVEERVSERTQQQWALGPGLGGCMAGSVSNLTRGPQVGNKRMQATEEEAGEQGGQKWWGVRVSLGR